LKWVRQLICHLPFLSILNRLTHIAPSFTAQEDDELELAFRETNHKTEKETEQQADDLIDVIENKEEEKPFTSLAADSENEENASPSEIAKKELDVAADESKQDAAEAAGGKKRGKRMSTGNQESAMIKSSEIFGAVKIRDGIFLGDQYSPQVSNTPIKYLCSFGKV